MVDTEERLTRSQVVARTFGVLFAASVFGLWIYAFLIYDPGLMVDELADRTFPIAAEEICAETSDRLDALPPAFRSPTAADRADVVEAANGELRTMVGRLRGIVPPDQGQITTGIGEWLDDWDRYIDDRQQYADGLRLDSESRFTESVKANRQISRAIDSFAQVNRMKSCTTPGDVG
ncbi:MAG: hypothetical protein ACKO5A_03735 [Actinomycetota bacterium]